ncbi:14-3-3 protein sigma-like [Molossus nigricans]
MERASLIQKARLAEPAERSEDTAAFRRSAVGKGEELYAKSETRCRWPTRMCWVARGLPGGSCPVSSRKAMRRARRRRAQRCKNSGRRWRLSSGRCDTALGLLDTHLIKEAGDAESRVFCLKMKGDCYRYLAEVATGDDKKRIIDSARPAYQEAMDISQKEMPPTNPIRLGLALNFPVFHYEIANSPEEAISLAKTTFDEAMADLHTLSEDPTKTAPSSCRCFETP